MKKRPRKQSSARVSSIAARMLGLCRRGEIWWSSSNPYAGRQEVQIGRAVEALAASVLSQDEQPGQQRKRGRKR